MDLEFIVLRIIHIGLGSFWFGTSVFMATILEPRLRALGPTIQKPVMGALMPVLSKVLTFSGAVTIAAGVAHPSRVHVWRFERRIADGT